jgi:hypothetical protein
VDLRFFRFLPPVARRARLRKAGLRRYCDATLEMLEWQLHFLERPDKQRRTVSIALCPMAEIDPEADGREATEC